MPGRDLQETLSERFGGRNVPKSAVINNWTDDEALVPLPKDHPGVRAFKERYGLAGKFVVMYSGNIGLYYDLENLIEVIGSFKGRDDVAFAFVGEGAVKPRLEEYVLENGLSNVSFIPYQPKDELVYSLNAADVHLVTNAKGQQGRVVPQQSLRRHGGERAHDRHPGAGQRDLAGRRGVRLRGACRDGGLRGDPGRPGQGPRREGCVRARPCDGTGVPGARTVEEERGREVRAGARGGRCVQD